MRSLSDQNFYEILDVSPETTVPEIERAYRIARATYHPSSAATYSLFSEEENAEILRRVEEAYAVLSDARLRREYDARLRRTGSGERPRPLTPARLAPPPSLPVRARPVELELDEPAEPADGVYDGVALRRIRMSRGVEIEEISALTKINGQALQFIETNRYHELPAPVYLRGFLREYAKCLRLDPRRVADTYMAQMAEDRGRLEGKA